MDKVARSGLIKWALNEPEPRQCPTEQHWVAFVDQGVRSLCATCRARLRLGARTRVVATNSFRDPLHVVAALLDALSLLATRQPASNHDRHCMNKLPYT